jgi:hypothetical protein
MGTTLKAKRLAPSAAPAATIRKPRSVSVPDRLVLYGRAAGHCSFRGCPVSLVQHHLEQTSGNFGETAHIWAFSVDGPRGDEDGRPEDPDTLENLILLCPICHKLVDRHPARYPVAELIQHRAEHEARVRQAVGVNIEHKALVLTLSAKVSDQSNAIPIADIQDALRPRYVCGEAFSIAHEMGPDESPEAIRVAALHVSRQLDAALALFERHGAPPIAVFGIAPIPLLIHLGTKLGNKRESLLFQLHRVGGWTWKTDGDPVMFKPIVKLRDGRKDHVALLVNVSGRNGIERLPESYGDATVYELAPADREPDRFLIRRKEDIESFRRAYAEAIAEIRRAHDDPAEVGLFPAVPIPFAIAIGTELLPKADPALVVHDWRKDKFLLVMKVNT